MTSTTLSQPTLSPTELSYLYTSLSLSSDTTSSAATTGPIRPDSRTPTQFRPLVAEADILPSCFGSARVIIGGGEGGECIVGIKGEVEKSSGYIPTAAVTPIEGSTSGGRGENWRSWVEVNVDTQGLRDDDALNIVIGSVIGEGLFVSESESEKDYIQRTTSGGFIKSLRINDKFHWKLYIDILLITSPSTSTSHPLTLTSLTTYLALTTTKLPLLTSQGNEDPTFNDDWDQAIPLYPSKSKRRPPISLLAMSAGSNVFVDPSREELSVAEGCWCVTVDCGSFSSSKETIQVEKGDIKGGRKCKILGIRTLESFSSPTIPADVESSSSTPPLSSSSAVVGGRGGINIRMLKKVVQVIGSIAPEVWEALEETVERERGN